MSWTPSTLHVVIQSIVNIHMLTSAALNKWFTTIIVHISFRSKTIALNCSRGIYIVNESFGFYKCFHFYCIWLASLNFFHSVLNRVRLLFLLGILSEPDVPVFHYFIPIISWLLGLILSDLLWSSLMVTHWNEGTASLFCRTTCGKHRGQYVLMLFACFTLLCPRIHLILAACGIPVAGATNEFHTVSLHILQSGMGTERDKKWSDKYKTL